MITRREFLRQVLIASGAILVPRYWQLDNTMIRHKYTTSNGTHLWITNITSRDYIYLRDVSPEAFSEAMKGHQVRLNYGHCNEGLRTLLPENRNG